MEELLMVAKTKRKGSTNSNFKLSSKTYPRLFIGNSFTVAGIPISASDHQNSKH